LERERSSSFDADFVGAEAVSSADILFGWEDGC
jgi:hypothetical protein